MICIATGKVSRFDILFAICRCRACDGHEPRCAPFRPLAGTGRRQVSESVDEYGGSGELYSGRRRCEFLSISPNHYHGFVVSLFLGNLERDKNIPRSDIFYLLSLGTSCTLR